MSTNEHITCSKHCCAEPHFPTFHSGSHEHTFPSQKNANSPEILCPTHARRTRPPQQHNKQDASTHMNTSPPCTQSPPGWIQRTVSDRKARHPPPPCSPCAQCPTVPPSARHVEQDLCHLSNIASLSVQSPVDSMFSPAESATAVKISYQWHTPFGRKGLSDSVACVGDMPWFHRWMCVFRGYMFSSWNPFLSAHQEKHHKTTRDLCVRLNENTQEKVCSPSAFSPLPKSTRDTVLLVASLIEVESYSEDSSSTA